MSVDEGENGLMTLRFIFLFRNLHAPDSCKFDYRSTCDYILSDILSE